MSSDRLTPDEFEPQPTGRGYLAQVEAYFDPDDVEIRRLGEGEDYVTVVYSSKSVKRVQLQVRAEKPRDLIDEPLFGAELTRGFNPVNYSRKRRWGHFAPHPENVAEVLAEWLQVPMRSF